MKIYHTHSDGSLMPCILIVPEDSDVAPGHTKEEVATLIATGLEVMADKFGTPEWDELYKTVVEKMRLVKS